MRVHPPLAGRAAAWLAAAALAAPLALAACTNPNDDDPGGGGNGAGGERSVQLGYASTSPIATILAAEERGSWAEHGLEVSLESVNDVGLSTNLVVGNQAQFGHTAPTTAFAAMSQGVPITIISGLAFGHGDNQAGFLAAPAASGIETLADLRGKNVAVTGIGTSYDYYLRARLDAEGLTAGEDVQLLPVPYPQMLGALDSGEVDAALLLAIDYARLSDREPVNVLATTAELAGAPIEYTSAIVARTDWLEANRETAVDFLAGLLTAEQWLEEDIASNDGAEVRELLQPTLQYDDPTMDTYFQYRLRDIGQESSLTNLLGMPREFVEPAIAALETGGGLDGDQQVTYDAAVDLSYLHEAYEQAGLTWNDDSQYQ